MSLLDRIPLGPVHADLALRLGLAAIFLSHGVTRAVMDRVAPFGAFLDGVGLPVGIAWAWGVTVFEILGSLALLLGVQRRLVCILFIVQMLVGIALVHLRNGWFVVGHGTGGMEFSVMLIAGLLAVFALGNSGASRRGRSESPVP